MAVLSKGVVESSCARETEALGAALAASLRPGDVVLLRGDVGTGKTTLVRGACRSLGVEGPVTSPTFTLARRYRGRQPVSHIDLYRLEGGLAGEAPDLLGEYALPGDLVFVEWPDRGGGWPGEVAVELRLSHLGGDRRRIEIG